MRGLICTCILGVGVACTGVALAAPGRDARAKYKRAVLLDEGGDAEQALVTIEEGLAIAPKDLKLLGLKGAVLIRLRDYSGALTAYQAFLAAGAAGANRRDAENIVNNLRAVESTFLDISLASGSATIYLDSKTLGVFCAAAPACHKPVLPGEYKVIAEQSGFERWTGRVTVASGKTAGLSVTLVEKPSQLTVRVTPSGARVTVDGAAYDPAARLAGGTHQVVASLAGYAEERREVEAHAGQPVALDVALTPLVPIRISPATTTLLLDDRPVTIIDGNIAIPPGAHVVTGRAPGFLDRRIEIPAVRVADYRLDLELAAEPPRAEPAAAPPASSRLTDQRKIALVVGGVGLGVAAGGLLLARQSTQLDDQARALCPASSNPCPDAVAASAITQRGKDRAQQASIAYGVAGGAVVVAAALWLTGAPASRFAIAIAPRLGDVAGLDVAGRF